MLTVFLFCAMCGFYACIVLFEATNRIPRNDGPLAYRLGGPPTL